MLDRTGAEEGEEDIFRTLARREALEENMRNTDHERKSQCFHFIKVNKSAYNNIRISRTNGKAQRLRLCSTYVAPRLTSRLREELLGINDWKENSPIKRQNSLTDTSRKKLRTLVTGLAGGTGAVGVSRCQSGRL